MYNCWLCLRMVDNTFSPPLSFSIIKSQPLWPWVFTSSPHPVSLGIWSQFVVINVLITSGFPLVLNADPLKVWLWETYMVDVSIICGKESPIVPFCLSSSWSPFHCEHGSSWQLWSQCWDGSHVCLVSRPMLVEGQWPIHSLWVKVTYPLQ